MVHLCRLGGPKRLVDIIDWSTMRLEPTALQLPGFTEQVSDLMYSVELQSTGSRRAWIVLMFEHKSGKDSRLAEQMADYQFRAYLQERYKSLIVPIVVQQGAPDEVGPVRFSDLFEDLSAEHLEVLNEYAVSFSCAVINVDSAEFQRRVRGTEIEGIVYVMSRVRGFKSEWLPELLEQTWPAADGERQRVFEAALGYVCDYNSHITTDDILKLRAERPEVQQMVDSALDYFRQEGMQRGMDKGRAEGMEKGMEKGRAEGHQEVAMNLLQEGMEPDRVAGVTNLSQEQVEELRQKINGVSKRTR